MSYNLHETANELLTLGKGILAADESKSTHKALYYRLFFVFVTSSPAKSINATSSGICGKLA
jgi:hypothetical protein